MGSAVALNQNSNFLGQRILRGDYQIVISSPEAFLDVDKLRNVVMADELQDYRHFVEVDEAHVIKSWGDDFRKAYGHVGNLRAMLFDVPFSAVTATATLEIKAAVIDCLHLGSTHPLVQVNLGNFRSNIEYSVDVMVGGSKSYQEITKHFPFPKDVGPTLVFVNSINDAHAITDVLREHLKWTGDLAQRVRPYHANRAQGGKDDAW